MTIQNENTTYQNVWDAIKVVLEETIALNAYVRKEDFRSVISASSLRN